jgi:hypothetical protein
VRIICFSDIGCKGYSVGRKFGKTFFAPSMERADWGYSWEGDKPGNLEAYAGEIKGTYDPRFEKLGKYIGSLDSRTATLRFIPASEKPEEHIKTQERQAEEMDKNVEQGTAANRP